MKVLTVKRAAKLAVSALTAATMAATSEAMLLGVQSGVSPNILKTALSLSTSACWSVEVGFAPLYRKKNFAVDTGRKKHNPCPGSTHSYPLPPADREYHPL